MAISGSSWRLPHRGDAYFCAVDVVGGLVVSVSWSFPPQTYKSSCRHLFIVLKPVSDVDYIYFLLLSHSLAIVSVILGVVLRLTTSLVVQFGCCFDSFALLSRLSCILLAAYRL